ncbi:MarR family winged helix-turn-helix transcriptional regulator [Seohaeicola zhoushanensis]|uniref:MarR family transcriptional regulator n=1 Tax=Seohaeicola zhoushanensis TaxID=1569283 RepID=A0A8J3GW88_9RHOB|nr:MarR family transcriptional regulator [Seohaeicola zhoushanensis]GHF43721.1 MarR family transcriptional regulator [Seohaeicola zhoushanensis]
MKDLDRTPSKQRLRLWLRMLSAHRGVEAQLRERLREDYDSTLPRFDVMAALDRYRDGLRMSDLSARLKVSNGNVTGIVERLVSEGLVERAQVDGDRRAMLVRLTPAGIERFAAMAADHEAWINDMLTPFSGAELDTLITLLDRIGDHPA